MTKAQIEEAVLELFRGDHVAILVLETALLGKAVAAYTLADVVDILCRKLEVKE